MPTISGVHYQTHTQRQIAYWASFDTVGAALLFFVAAFSDGQRRHLGTSEGFVPCESGDVPADLRIRSAVLSYIDKTAFGEGKLPDAKWIGWRGGPVL